MSVKLSEPVKHTATFGYLKKQISYCYWSNNTPGMKPDTVLFLGTGQIGKIPKWVANLAPPGVVVVEGLPHWHSDPSGNDLEDFTRLYTESAFRAVLEFFGNTRMHVIGVSQATPGAIWLANDMSENVGNVALALPMGLTTSNLGETDKDRYRELRRRSIKTLLQFRQSPIHDVRNIYITALLTRIVITGMSNGSTVNKYTKGVSRDMKNDFKVLISNKEKFNRHVSLIVGGDDQIFPIHDIQQSLDESTLENLDVTVIPNMAHSSLAIKSSQQIIEQAVGAVRGKND